MKISKPVWVNSHRLGNSLAKFHMELTHLGSNASMYYSHNILQRGVVETKFLDPYHPN